VPKPLSPAAAAIVKAFTERHELCGPFDGNWPELCLAVAMRALAGHQPQRRTLDGPQDHWDPDERTRQELRNIAAELEQTHA
jgi:hypothetical protein